MHGGVQCEFSHEHWVLAFERMLYTHTNVCSIKLNSKIAHIIDTELDFRMLNRNEEIVFKLCSLTFNIGCEWQEYM